MPVHLPPLSRRRFLASSLLAGAGMMFGRGLHGAEKRVDENCWALFSDIHVAADRATVARGINMTDHFEAVSREVLELPTRPARLLVNGDCAFNTGEEGDYATLEQLLRPLREAGMPVDLTVGNHDVRERFWSALTEARAAKRPLVDRNVAVIKTPLVNWFVLDSLEKTLETPGIFGKAQLNWLARELDANSGKPAIVVAHHNLAWLGDAKMAAKDGEELIKIIRPRTQVKAYFFGHTHIWQHKQDESGIHLVNLPPVAYVFQPGLPSGWVHTTLELNGARLQLHCLDRSHKDHGQVLDLNWRAT
jgi:3',5'-cyclic AMP phosphodiesterase CpdA